MKKMEVKTIPQLKAQSKKAIWSMHQLKDLIEPLAKAAPSNKRKNVYLRVFQGAYKRAYDKYKAIDQLCEQRELSGAIMVLARSITEDRINLEYMLLSDKQKAANAFAKYRWIQYHQDIQFYKRVGVDDEVLEGYYKHTEKKYQKIKNEYKKEDDQIFKNWSGIDVDGMLRKFMKEATRSKNQKDQHTIRLMAGAYLSGNKKAHFNPLDVVPYLRINELTYEYEITLSTSLHITLSSMIWLTIYYIDEISAEYKKNMYKDLYASTKKLYRHLL
jgi:hypothetical protein